jgi:hypothetical protein
MDGESETCVAAHELSQSRTCVLEEREDAGLCWSVERESAGGGVRRERDEARPLLGARRPAKPVY